MFFYVKHTNVDATNDKDRTLVESRSNITQSREDHKDFTVKEQYVL